MSKLILKSGDLFTTGAPAIGHGVNVDPGVMGSGIAVLFRDRFPDMHAAYKVLCAGGKFPVGSVMVWERSTPTIYNIASQDRPGRNARLEWLRTGVEAALSDAEARGYDRLALPRIGCGIGGLDWSDVEPLLAELAAGSSVDLEVWSL